MTTGLTHTISITLARGTTNTAYSFLLDDILLRAKTFVLNDTRAINSAETGQGGAAGSSAGFATIDDLRVVPEPATGLMLCIGSLVSLSISRRRNSSE